MGVLCAAVIACVIAPLACSRNSSPAGGAAPTPSPTATSTLTPTMTATWAPGNTINTCDPYAAMTVGSYVVEADFWDQGSCPGTQCMNLDNATGAFSVTECPNCGSTVASYPNVLYGCSFGTCSPGTVLPLEVSSLTTVTSSWAFGVGGISSDQYDVAYDIWFCPINTCSSSSFPCNGTELMIWLDYKNLTGWQNFKGSVSLGGYNWQVWQAAMSGWTYLAYLIQGPVVTSVTNLDLNAFFQDAVTRGYVKNFWYLYAIQAGDELRTGGLPYNNVSFSVSIN